jgi:hypothetical protein
MPRIAEAAEAIHVLINSTPRTPSQAEIAAVIGKTLAAPDAETRKLKVEWAGLLHSIGPPPPKCECLRTAYTGSRPGHHRVLLLFRA